MLNDLNSRNAKPYTNEKVQPSGKTRQEMSKLSACSTDNKYNTENNT